MARRLVLLLVLANAGYWGWSQGWLSGLGLGPALPNEPERVARQLRPEAVQLTVSRPANPPASGAATAASTPAVTTCLQAGPLDPAQAEAVRKALAALPGEAWRLMPMAEPARWMVFMGKFDDDEALARKKDELARLNVAFDPAVGAAWQRGLALGRFGSEANAQAALKQLEGRGVKTARVVQERPEGKAELLRLPVVDEALRERLATLKPGLPKPLQPCG